MMWRPDRIWERETAVILAGGPSLRGFDSEVLRVPGVRVITINDSRRLAPWADVHYYCDQPWMEAQKDIDLDTGRWVKGGDVPGVDPRVKVLRFTGQLGFDADPGCLRTGSNSGYQCIHLAAHLGASRIVLLGYDMHIAGARTHWHDGPRHPASVFARNLQRDFLPLFQFLVEPLKQRGIEVINATPDSALKCWPYLPLEEAIRSI